MNRSLPLTLRTRLRHALIQLALLPALLLQPLAYAQTESLNRERETTTNNDSSSSSVPRNDRTQGGPARLRQGDETRPGDGDKRDGDATNKDPKRSAPRVPPTQASEFEAYVQQLAEPVEIRRFGSDLMTALGLSQQGGDFNPLVPSDYLVQPGDELSVTIWGSVDADLRLVVDRSGRIQIPRVGSIMVSGVRYAELPELISRRVATVFKNFELSVTLGQLRGVRVYVTGFVVRPGAHVVSSLSTVAGALFRAGGPSAAGSFRRIQLKRAGAVVANLDLYDLLLKGDRTADRLVMADDVIHVEPVGPQVGLIGSVNRPAVFEIKPGEIVADLLRMGGGFSPVADTTRLALERLDSRATMRVLQIPVGPAESQPLQNADVLRAFNAINVATSLQRQNKRVRIEGEVLRPGDYVLPPESTIHDALAAAGGLTLGAYVFGTDFSRESVRLRQQENYEKALRDLETEFARSTSTQRVTSADEAAAQTGRSAATVRLIERLRTIRPTGRVVLQLSPDSRELPNLLLEDGDRLLIPSQPSSIGVFGSVFNAGNYLREGNRSLSDYMRLAGGPTRGADTGSTFVIRANGTVVSNLQSKGLFGGLQSSFEQLPALPGDTIFIPEEIDKTTFVQYAKDWTTVLYQFALGVAAFKSLSN